MILIRKDELSIPEELTLEEFERLVRRGEIGPHTEVCFPVITGERFVPANELEVFRGLYQTGPITFRRHFSFERTPWLTLLVMAMLCGTYFFWQEPLTSTETLLQKGAKSLSLMVELGQWWRLLSANLLHVSGWHLGVNALFLFNLGGPAEAMFRRLDYALILITSAVGATALSTLINPSVSCGASGMVFGVWGACAVFGIRYRAILPDRYRRYFIGSVIPYSIFALYFGIAMPGVDNWAHLGGLASGVLVALFLPARLLQPRHTFLSAKVALLGLVFLLIAGASISGAGPGPLDNHRYFARNGLSVPVPQRWYELVSRRNPRSETHAFHNRAGVVVGLETSLETALINLEEATTQFIEIDLASQLEYNDARGVKILDPVDTTIGGHPAKLIRTEIMTPRTAQRADYYLIARGYYRYILSLSTPLWLAEVYYPILNQVLDQTQLVETDMLQAARSEVKASNNPASQAHLARALVLAGQEERGWNVLTSAMEQWPSAGAPTAVAAQLFYEQGKDAERGCELVTHALQHREWTPALILLGYKLHVSCDRDTAAKELLKAGLKRFPTNKTIKRKASMAGLATP